jgi:hypothetical protein
MAYTQAELTQALVNLLQTDPNAAYGDIVKAASTYGITPEQVQTTFGTLPAGNDRTYVPDYTPAQTTTINNAIASNDPIAQAYGLAEKTGDYGQIASLIKNIPAPTLLSKYGLTNKDISYIYSRPTVTDPLSTAYINAEKTGDYTTVANLLKGISADQLKATYNLNQNDINYIASRKGIAGTLPANWAGTPIKQVVTGTGTGVGLGTGIDGQTAPVGQFRELFPSFAESKRLATQTIAARPTTQSIVNMISNPQNPALTSAWQNAEKTGNYGDVAGMLQNMPLGKIQSAYGLSNADMQYIMSRPEIATALSKSGMVATPAPTLTNVLGMISK